MAVVKSRSVATGALALAGLVAAGVAMLGKTPEQTNPSDIPAPESLSSDFTSADTALEKPEENQNYDGRRITMSGSAKEIGAARRHDRIGSFRTVMPPIDDLRGAAATPKLGLNAASPLELRRDVLQSADSGAAPIEFIVKLKDKSLTGKLQEEFNKSPEMAERHLKKVLGGGSRLQGGGLQGFTLGGEAILRFEGPRDGNNFAKVHDEIQRALNAAPGVSFAEQNYTADINSAH